MCYVIANNDGFIKKGQYNNQILIVEDINIASKFKRYEAETVIETLTTDNGFTDLQIKFAVKFKDSIILDEDLSDHIKNDNYTDSVVKAIDAIRDDLKLRNAYLLSILSEVDLEISDIQHAAEFNEFNLLKGYKLYKLLHDTLLKRREIKNEIDKVDLILNTNVNNALSGKVDELLLNVNNKKYTPRVLKHLFKQ